jgi:hypothetical protein
MEPRNEKQIERCDKCFMGHFIGDVHVCPDFSIEEEKTDEEFLGFGYKAFCRVCDTPILKENPSYWNICGTCRERWLMERRKKAKKRKQKTSR